MSIYGYYAACSGDPANAHEYLQMHLSDMKGAAMYDADAFFEGYVKCALWSSTDPDTTEPLDRDHTTDDFTPEAREAMRKDCDAFVADNASDLLATGAHEGQGGHDFWLTRNGHGAGFWDRGYGAVGDRLTDAAKVYGESYVMPNGNDLEVM